MAREYEITNTNVKIDVKVMKQFKRIIERQGYRLHKGIEIALSDYNKKHKDKGWK